jgi:hypothetical protein
MANHQFSDIQLQIVSSGLCDQCKPYGECRLGLGYPDLETFWANKRRTFFKIGGNLLLTSENEFSSYALDKIRFYMLSVPTEIPKYYKRNNPAKHHLQTGLDAFHDEDYETALLHFEAYREVEDDIHVLANYVLAMIHFELKNYEKASYHYSYGKYYYMNRYNNEFDELCIAGLAIEAYQKEQVEKIEAKSAKHLTIEYQKLAMC